MLGKYKEKLLGRSKTAISSCYLISMLRFCTFLLLTVRSNLGHKEQPRDEVEANKKRGRPKKIIDNQEAEVEKARRGRPPKASLALQYDDEKRKAKKKRTKKH